MSYHELLKNIYLFNDFSSDDLGPVLRICTPKQYNSNDVIFTQDDEAKSLFIVKSGSIRILKAGKQGDEIEVGLLGAGSHFGEMPFLDGGRRSATAKAGEKSEIIQINYDDFMDFLATKPIIAMKIYRSLAIFLCGRLRITTMDLSFSREQNLTFF